MDGTEPQLRRAIHRSSSFEPLLESPPSSHCVAPAAGDEEAAAIPTPEKAAMVVYHSQEEATMASQERPSSPTEVAEGCGGQGRGAPWSYVGRLFSNKVSSLGAASKKGDTSSRGVEEEQEREGKKEKQNKRRSWMPDPEKRWPVQGW